jgi:prepilin-type N-terminal cleavage/methylation domain-containing protein
MTNLNRLFRRLRGESDGGFTLVEMAVSLGILSIVSTLAFSILLSTRNLSAVVTWQSSTNSELRQVIDGVFSDIETARPPLGCDTNSDGKADTLDVSLAICGSESKMVESEGTILLVASPNRICYYTNRLQSRQPGGTIPAYTPACLAVVPTSISTVSNLQLETFPAPAGNWNQRLDDTTRPPDRVRILATVDSSAAVDGFFEFYNATNKDASNKELKLTDSQNVTVAGAGVVTNALSGDDLKTVNSVVLKARMRLGGSAANKNQSRDIAYRVTLRAARYSAERCGFGNVLTGSTCQ